MSTHIRKVGLALAVGVIGIALLGAGCKNPFRKKPEDVIGRAYERAVAATSSQFSAVVGVDTREEGNTSGQPQHIDVQLTGAETKRDDVDARSEMTLTIATREENGTTVKAALGMRVINGVTYLKIDDVAITQNSDTQAMIDGVIGAVKGMIGGKWLRIDPKETTDLIKGFSPGTKIAIPDAEQAQEINRGVRAVFARHSMLVVREDLGDERVDGVAAYHYRFGLRPEEVRAFIVEFLPLFGVSTENVDRNLQKPEADTILRNATGEVWISKKTKDFLRFRYPIAQTYTGISFPAPGKRMTMTGQLEVGMKDWGKPVSIEAPADAKTLGEAFSSLLPALSAGMQIEKNNEQGSSDTGSRDMPCAPGTSQGGQPGCAGASVEGSALPSNIGGPIDTPQVDFKIGTGPDNDGDGLSNDMEARYGTDARLTDTDGDGFGDGEEVRGGYNPNGSGRLP